MKAAAIVLALSILTTGCVSSFMDDEGNDEETPAALDGSYKVFLAAQGSADGPVVATVESAKVATSDGVSFLTAAEEPLDLSELSTSGQAILVAAGTVTGAVTRHEIEFVDVTAGGSPIAAQATWSVPFNFSVTGEAEVTLTLDLEASVQDGAFVPVSDSLVVENANGVVAQAAKSELTGDARPTKVIEPLSSPEIRVEGGGGTFPTWPVGTTLNYTADIAPDDESRISDAFWFFDDGNTKQGLEVQHAFRQPGVHTVTVLIQGTEGQQANATVEIESWYAVKGAGEGLVAAGGEEVEEGRTHHNKEVKLDDADLVMSTIRISLNFSGASSCIEVPQVGEEECTPDESNVYVYLYDPDGNEIAKAEDDAKPKLLLAEAGNYAPGSYTLKVVAQSGTSIGYTYTAEAYFL